MTAAAAPAPLLDPAHPVVLFDGVCNLCNGAVRFVIARDPAARFRFAPLQSDVGRALLLHHRLDPAALETFVLIDGEGAHERSTAVLRLLRGLGTPWRWLWPLVAVPRPLRDGLYGILARNRYRWFGRRAQCMIPNPELLARFLA